MHLLRQAHHRQLAVLKLPFFDRPVHRAVRLEVDGERAIAALAPFADHEFAARRAAGFGGGRSSGGIRRRGRSFSRFFGIGSGLVARIARNQEQRRTCGKYQIQFHRIPQFHFRDQSMPCGREGLRTISIAPACGSAITATCPKKRLRASTALQPIRHAALMRSGSSDSLAHVRI